MRINIQSVSDIITNSSTEIYTVATDSTIDYVKNLIDSILKIGGSHLKFDDLFTIKYEFIGCFNPDPSDFIASLPLELGKKYASDLKYFEENKYDTSGEYYKKLQEFINDFINAVPDAVSYIKSKYDYDGFDIGLHIEAKDKNNKIANEVAKMLSELGIVEAFKQEAKQV